MKIWKIAGIALLVVIAATLVTGGMVFARSGSSTREHVMQDVSLKKHRDLMGHGKREHLDGVYDCDLHNGIEVKDGQLEALAEGLGLTPEALQAEFDAGKALPEIAAERGIEHTDLMAALGAEGACGMHGDFIRGGFMGHGKREHLDGEYDCDLHDGIEAKEGQLEALAEALGLTPEALQAEFDAGKALPEIAAELGIEHTDLMAALGAEGGCGMHSDSMGHGGFMSHGNHMEHGTWMDHTECESPLQDD